MQKRFNQNEQEWKEKLNTWKDSGKSGLAWCREHNISYKTFCNWKYRLSQKHLLPNGFLEIKEEKTTALDLDYQGFHLHIPKDVDTKTLTQCLQALKNISC